MSLLLSPLDRTIRDRVREEIRSSPGLFREYRKRRWARLRDDMGELLTAIASTWGAVFLFLLIPALATLLIVPALANGERNMPGPMSDKTLLALQALFISGISCILCGIAISPKRINSDTAIHRPLLVSFPVSDENHKRRFRRELLVCAAFSAVFAIPVYGYLAMNRGMSVPGLIATLLAVLAHGASLPAIWLFLEMSIRSRVRSIGLACLGVAIIAASAQLGGRNREIVANATLFILPNGWINGAFYYSVLEVSPVGGLLSAASIALVGYLVYSLRRPFIIQEILLEGNIVTGLLLEDGRAIRFGLPSHFARGSADYRPEFDGDDSFTEQGLRARLQSANGWLEPDWSKQGWVDGLLARRLTARERAVVENWIGGTPRFTRRLWTAAFSLAGIFVAFYLIPSPQSLAALYVGFFSFIAMTCLSNSTHSLYLSSLLPIGFLEPMRVAMKTIAALSPLWLFGAIATAICLSWVHKQPLPVTIEAAVLPLAILPPVCSLTILLTLAESLSVFYTWRFWIKWVCCYLAVALVLAAVFTSAGTLGRLKACGALSLVATVAWAWSWRTFHFRSVDILEPKR